jgi:hypothetical protein
MFYHRFASLILAVVLTLCLAGRWAQATSVTSYHNDNSESGLNSTETALTPANVVAGTFARRFATAVDGKVYAEPLYLPNIAVNGGPYAGTHNLVFVATQHDSLYAIDANSGVIVWQTSFTASGLAGATITSMPSADTSSSDTQPEIGICSTPVIDPTTNLIYVAAKTKQVVSGVNHYVYTLYKVNLTNGNATPNANIVASTIIGDTVYNSSSQQYTYHTANDPTAAQDIFVPGTGDGSITVNGQSRVYFNALRQMNRPALRLYNGTLYIAFGSHGDNGPYHGWLLAYNASTFTLTGVLNSTPNSGLGGFWGGGASPAIDSNGYVYLMTGNGTFDGSSNNGTTTGLDSLGFPVNGNYGDSVLKIATDTTTSVGNQSKNGWGLRIVDYFTPFNEQNLDDNDTDLGSGGVTILPDSAGSSAHPHLLVGAGKQGNLYLIDRDNMGKFSATTDNVVQSETAISSCFSTASFFNGVLYSSSVEDHLKAFTVANAQMATNPVTSVDGEDWPGATAAVSANGTTNGIVWLVDNGTSQLRAYLASNIGTELYTSGQIAADALGTAQKFAVPTVADGQVFVPTSNSLVVYGLPVAGSSAPAPPSNLTATAVSGLQINLAWTDNSTNENGFAIEQSTDGVNFSQIGTVGVNTTTYISNSNLASGTTYYYRVRAYNGTGNSIYSAYSNTAQATTTGIVAALNFPSGFASSNGTLVYNGNAKIVGSRCEITDGGMNEDSTVFSAVAQNIQQFSSQFTFQMTNASADGITFIIQNNAATSLGTGGGDLGFGGLPKSLAVKFDLWSNAGEGNDSTGLYVNGVDPYVPATDLTPTGIELNSGDVISVLLSYNGTTLTEKITDTVTGATTTLNYTINIPATMGANTAYVGFGGGTGGATAVSDILTWTFAPLATSAPAAPSNLVATAVSGTQINLSWTDNSSNESGFIIMRSTNGGAYTQAGVTGTGVATYSDSALTPNTTYSYEVEATNNAGNSAFSNVATALTPIPPATPTNAQATSITQTTISLSWTNNANNATGYNILRKTTTGANFALIASLPASATTYTDTGLTPGTSYDYHIQAYNVAGYSDFSGFTAVTLSATSTQPAVSVSTTTLQVKDGSSGSFTVSLASAPMANTTVNVSLSGTPALTVSPTAITMTPTAYQKVTVTVTAAAINSNDSNRSATVTASTSSSSANVVVTDVVSDAQTASNLTTAATPLTGTNIGAGSGDSSVRASGAWWVDGSGAGGISGTADAFHFESQSVTGNFTMLVQLQDLVAYGATSPRAGLMIRDGSAAGSNFLALAGNASTTGGYDLDSRTTPNAASSETVTAAAGQTYTYPNAWMMLTRVGNTLHAYVSSSGGTFTEVTNPTTGVTWTGMSTALNIGVFSSSASSANARAVFTNFGITLPATTTPTLTDVDLGSPGLAGSASLSNGVYTLKGCGSDIWGNTDQFNFDYATASGDNTMIVQATALQNTDAWAKGGLMFRNSLSAGSAYFGIFATAGYGIAVQYRDSDYANAVQPSLSGGIGAPCWLKIVRSGTTMTAYYATTTGTPGASDWILVTTHTVTYSSTSYYAGLADCSHNGSLLATDTFANLSIGGSTAVAPPPPPPATALSDADEGSPPLAGSASVSGGVYTLKGCGSDIWGNTDQFNFDSIASSGDATMIVQASSLQNTDAWAKGGLMFRNSLDTGSAYFGVFATAGYGVAVQYRDSDYANAVQVSLTGGIAAPCWLKLVRSGTTMTAYYATTPGTPAASDWVLVATHTVPYASTSYYAGMADCSHTTSALATDVFSNFSLTSP